GRRRAHRARGAAGADQSRARGRRGLGPRAARAGLAHPGIGVPSQAGQVVEIRHPLVQHKLGLMRKRDTSTSEFRSLLAEISMLLAYEVTHDLPTHEVAAETPVASTTIRLLDGKKIVLVSILRAGNGLLDGMLRILPSARVGHVGLFRDPETLQAVEYYFKVPHEMTERDVVVLDPMLATGNSAIAAVRRLRATRPRSIRFVCLLTCPAWATRAIASSAPGDRAMRLAGKVALISGGARGMGAAEGRLFAREGARVVLGDVLDAEGKQVADAITAAGGQALYVHLDVTREADWERAVATAVSRFGKLDVLINNAGVGGGSRLEDTTEEAWDRGMDVNAKSVFLGTKAAIPAMRRAGGGSIVNIASQLGLVGMERSSAWYQASKGAVATLTKHTAVQYARERIRCNS